MSRRTAREYVLQNLYQREFNSDGVISYKDLNDDDNKFYNDLLLGVVENREEIDKVIQKNLKVGWTLSRLSLVDVNILRLATYELLFKEDIPESVTLNESVDITKRFSSEESSKFINGVLASVASHKNNT